MELRLLLLLLEVNVGVIDTSVLVKAKSCVNSSSPLQHTWQVTREVPDWTVGQQLA
jgi:hypothetical protein